MSATRQPVRDSLDVYPTPHWCILKLEDILPDLNGLRVLEPAAGEGNILKALKEIYPILTVDSIEIRGECSEALHDLGSAKVTTGDFLTLPPEPIYDAVITNPPYTRAMEFIKNSFNYLKDPNTGLVVMLLRLSFLESIRRVDFLQENTPNVYVLSKRPSFTGKGTDACAYAWMVWSHQTLHGHYLEII